MSTAEANIHTRRFEPTLLTIETTSVTALLTAAAAWGGHADG